MTTPANLTFTDIQTRVMNHLRIPTTNTTEATKIGYMINELYRDIAAKQDWWWLLKRGIMLVTPKIADTSVTVTLNSASGSFSVSPKQNSSNVSVANFSFIPSGVSADSSALYFVTAHTSGATAFTLDGVYTNATGTVSANLYQDRLGLPSDCGKIIHVQRYGRSLPLRRVGIEEMQQYKLTDRTEGTPEAYSVYDYGTTGDPTTQRWLSIHPFPDGNYHRLQLFYKQNLNTELSGTTQPFIPDDYRQVLIYGSLARGYPIWLDDTERGKYFQTLFNDLMALMAAQQKEYASDKSGVAPENAWRGISRRRAGNSTLGSWFDRLPNQP